MTPAFPLAAIVMPAAAISLVLAVALLHMGNRANIVRASLWWAFGFVLNATILAVPSALQLTEPAGIVLSLGAAPALLLLLGSLRYLHRSALISIVLTGIVVVVVAMSQGLPSSITQRALNAALFLSGGLALFANGAVYLLHRRRSTLPFAVTAAAFLTWGAVRTAEGFYPPPPDAVPWAVVFEPMMATIAGIALMLISRHSRGRGGTEGADSATG
jgi:hypothetical protein